MAIRRITSQTKLQVGSIVMSASFITHGLCNWPRKVVEIHGTRLTLALLRPTAVIENDDVKVRYQKSLSWVADTEDEAFAFFDKSMEHSKSAEERVRALERQLRAERVELISQMGIHLEELIDALTHAIDRRDQEAIDTLVVSVEKEADKIGYENHARLANLYTRAEKVGIEDNHE